MTKRILTNLFLFFFSISFFNSYGALSQKNLHAYGFKAYFYRDQSNKDGLWQILDKEFTPAKSDIFNFGLDSSTYWIKINVTQNQFFKNEYILIDQSRLAIAKMYIYCLGGKIKSINPSFWFPHTTSKFTQGIIFPLPDTVLKDDVIYLQLRAKETFLNPVSIVKENSLFENASLRTLIFGFYTGIMCTMFLYNLFLYLIIRDKSYLYYIFYIFFTWLTQITIQGFASNYFWAEDSYINNYAVVLFSSLALIFALFFTISFLNTRVYSRIWHALLTTLCVLAFLNLCNLFAFGTQTSFIIMQLLTVLSSALAICTSYYVYFKKHFKPAGYYLVAWSILLLGVILFVIKDYGIIPYNIFTVYLLQISASIEVMLLSFALADKINFFKKENEIAQGLALKASLENQKLIKEQNIILEQNVQERTEELQNANSTLKVTLANLKDTQSQLVDAEKMAALGQLTAGIAHEINNPINFVTSNIKPLQLDIDDLKEIISKYENIDYSAGDVSDQVKEVEAFKKQIDLEFINNEIDSLLVGIADGAKRTAEIIRSLRNFSRLDEDDLKPVDLNEGLHSTLVLVRNSMPDNVKVIKNFSNLPKVECLPGKINQVFMNLISNAIQAIKSNGKNRDEEFLTITTHYENDQVIISIKDTGTGMTDEVKQKIFEPFFTTKEVGEGTGLGLSIVFSIIEKHKGHIDVLSQVDQGTEFIITLPVNTPQ